MHHYSEERDDRVKETAEFFTPPHLVNKMLDGLDVDWDNIPDKTFIDPTCGSGNFLVALAERGVPPKNIFGVDLMHDNVVTTHRRLTEVFLSKGYAIADIEFHLKRNVIRGNATTYHYDFYEYENLDEQW